jgi:beta-galactosidase/beta-glucuronidase
MIKNYGFNMVRKHIKVEPYRWYYWADKLGLLVWQDMPSENSYTEHVPPIDSVAYASELTRMIKPTGTRQVLLPG